MWLFRNARLVASLFTWVLFGLSSFVLLDKALRGQMEPGFELPLIVFSSYFFILSILFARFACRTGTVITLVILVTVNLVISALALPQQMLWNNVCIIPFTLVLMILIARFQTRHQEFTSEKNARISEYFESCNLLTLELKKNAGIRESFIKKMDRYWKFRKTAETLASILSISDLCERIVHSTREIIDKGDAYFLYLCEDEPLRLELKNHIILTNQISADALAEPDEYMAWALNNRQPLCVSNTETDFRFSSAGKGGGATQSMIIHPLISAGATIGFLRIDSLRKDFLNLEDLRVLSIISHLFSLLLQTVRLFLQTIELAIKDSLTGLFVRRYFDEETDDLIARARQQSQTFSVLLLDMDMLKKCNDELGHMVGDILLQNTAKKIKAHAPAQALAARYGGEEFAVLLPEMSKDKAFGVAEEIRRNIEEMELTIRRRVVRTTISIGISQFPTDGKDRETLLKKADTALYRAKQEGRNRSVLC